MAQPSTNLVAGMAIPPQVALDENTMVCFVTGEYLQKTEYIFLKQRFKPSRIFKYAVETEATSTATSRTSMPHHITGLTFDDQGDFLLTASEDETFRLYNVKTGK